MDGDQHGTGALPPHVVVDPFDDTAPQPVVHAHQAHPHHHEGAPGPAVSPAGHHVAPAATVVAGRHQGRRRRTTLIVASAAVAALAVLAAVGWALAGRGPATSAEPSSGLGASSNAESAPSGATGTSGSTGDAAPQPMLPASQPTLVLGDSLGLVAYPYLADLVPDRYVSYEAEVGRSTAGTAKALAKLASVPPVVIVSSGTNDGTAAELGAGATTILDALGTQRCVVWVDVVRPDTVGDTQEAMNAALDAVAAGRPNVTVLRWSALVAEHPEWLAGDGIHPTEEGAKARAQAYADASAACSPIDPAAPKADKQYLPDSVFWGPVSGSGHQGSSQGSGSGNGSSATRSSSSGSSGSASSSSSPSTSRTSSPTTSPKPSPTASTSAPAEPPPTSSAPQPPAETTAAAAPAPTA